MPVDKTAVDAIFSRAGVIECDAISKKANRVAFQYQAGQSTGRICAGVNVDTIVAHIGVRYWRMPVNDHLAEILFAQQKVFANPEQIIVSLFIEGNPRPHSCVNEEKVAAFER
jgi:hypothetical protein